MKPSIPTLHAVLSCMAAALLPLWGAAADGPAPITPQADASLAIPFVDFTWTPHPLAFADTAAPVRYEIQIARDSGFSDIVDEDAVFLPRYVNDKPLPAGNFFWRVRAVPHGEEPGAWSTASSLGIRACDETITVAYDPDADDHTAAAQDAIDRAIALNQQDKSVEVVFPKGLYRSNTPGRCFLIIQNADGLVINGNGSSLHLGPYDATFRNIDSSRHVLVRDFIVDMTQQPPFSQGRVLAVDREKAVLELAFEPGFPNFDDAWFKQAVGSLKLLHPEINGRLKTGAPSWFRLDPESFEKTGDRRFRASIATPSYPVEGGKVVVSSVTPAQQAAHFSIGDRFVYALYSDRLSCQLHANHSGRITFYQITNHAGIRHFFAFDCSNLNFLHCHIGIKPGRWFNGLADGIHTRNNRVGPWVEGVEIDGIGDDAVALYSRPMTIAAKHPESAPDRLILKPDFFSARAGDKVSFFRPQTGEILLETRVSEVSPAGTNHDVRFEHAVPAELNIGKSLTESDQIWNRSVSCGGFVVRNSRLLGVRRFGVVFRADSGVIENNLFRGVSAAPVIFLNETQYPNGLYANEIIIRNNEMRDCAFDTMPAAVITTLFKRLGGSEPAASMATRGILIENNTIADCLRPAMEFWGTRDVVIRNNTVNGAPFDGKDPKQFLQRHCEEIRFSDAAHNP